MAILRRPDEKACLTSKTKPKNLSGTTRLLGDMVADKEIKVKHFDSVKPDYYFLPTTKSISDHSRKHEHLCGDLYVAYETLGRDLKWERPTDYEENLALGLFPDRQMVLDGNIVFWEVDRGTEDYFSDKGITGKIEKYIQLSELHKNQRFNVVFTTVDAKQSAKARGDALLDIFEHYKRGDQFLVTLHKWATAEPLEPVFLSPLNPMGITLLPAI